MDGRRRGGPAAHPPPDAHRAPQGAPPGQRAQLQLRKMWDSFGNAFDFFAFRGLTKLTDAGDNYIRVVDSVKGIGFDNEDGPLSQWGFGSTLSCKDFTFDRVQGNGKQLDKTLPMRIPCI